MFVACPHCGFFVAAQAGANLRCPRCGSAIDAKQAKPLEKPDSPAQAEPMPEPAPAAAVVADNAAGSTTDPGAAPAAASPPRRRRGTHAPSFARRHAPAPVRATTHWRGWLLVAALGLLLLAQLLFAQRAELAADARWRPLVTGACALVRCEVPAWREPAAFTMLQRSVQPKAGTRGVLRVSASFRNDARWEQPWPTVVLTLSDMDGRQVGRRAFAPAEYRDGRDDGGIAPGQSATLQLDVVEPARQVVAFTFDFH